MLRLGPDKTSPFDVRHDQNDAAQGEPRAAIRERGFSFHKEPGQEEHTAAKNYSDMKVSNNKQSKTADPSPIKTSRNRKYLSKMELQLPEE